jgi:hypothetical protein
LKKSIDIQKKCVSQVPHRKRQAKKQNKTKTHRTITWKIVIVLWPTFRFPRRTSFSISHHQSETTMVTALVNRNQFSKLNDNQNVVKQNRRNQGNSVERTFARVFFLSPFCGSKSQHAVVVYFILLIAW